MSRNLHANTEAALDANQVNYRVLVYMDWPTGDIFLWNGYGDLEVDGDAYIGTGDLVQFNLPTEDAGSIAQGMTANITIDNDVIEAGEVTHELAAAYAGRRMSIKLGMFDDDGVLQGEYYTIFAGLLDSDDIEDNGQSVSLTLRAENRLADPLRRRNPRYTSQSQASLYAITDKFFDFVESQQTQDLKW